MESSASSSCLDSVKRLAGVAERERLLYSIVSLSLSPSLPSSHFCLFSRLFSLLLLRAARRVRGGEARLVEVLSGAGARWGLLENVHLGRAGRAA